MDSQTLPPTVEEEALEEEFKNLSRSRIIKFHHRASPGKVGISPSISGALNYLLRQCFIYERNLGRAWLEEVKKNPNCLPDHDPDSFLMVTSATRRLLKCLCREGLCNIDYKVAQAQFYPDRTAIAQEGYALNKKWRDEEIAYRKWRGRVPKEEYQREIDAGKKPWLEDLYGRAPMPTLQKS